MVRQRCQQTRQSGTALFALEVAMFGKGSLHVRFYLFQVVVVLFLKHSLVNFSGGIVIDRSISPKLHLLQPVVGSFTKQKLVLVGDFITKALGNRFERCGLGWDQLNLANLLVLVSLRQARR